MIAILQTIFSKAFFKWKYIDVDSSVTEICSQGSNLQYSSTGSDNGLGPASLSHEGRVMYMHYITMTS